MILLKETVYVYNIYELQRRIYCLISLFNIHSVTDLIIAVLKFVWNGSRRSTSAILEQPSNAARKKLGHFELHSSQKLCLINLYHKHRFIQTDVENNFIDKFVSFFGHIQGPAGAATMTLV